MRIDARDRDRQPLGVFNVKASQHPAEVRDEATGRVVALQWEKTLDEQDFLRRCPLCGCRELFHRKDFPQGLGLAVVVAAGAASVVMFALGGAWIVWSVAVLAAAVAVDALIYAFTGRCLVCYRCRSEFRDAPIHESIEGWELAVGEKYRPVRRRAAAANEGSPLPP